jgi:exopolysaccharide biosynthesis polyprenyl glycosylphosphotransferase
MIQRRQLLIHIHRIFDLALLTFALWDSVFDHFDLPSFIAVFQGKMRVHTLVEILAILGLWRISLSAFGLYQSKRMDPRLPEIFALIKASLAAAISVLLVALAFQNHTVTPSVLIRFALLAAAFLIGSRLIVRQYLRMIRRRGYDLRQMLVVGTNKRAAAFVGRVGLRSELGYRIVGFVDDRFVDPATMAAGYTLVSNLQNFRSYIRNNVIDEVVITLPIKSFYDLENEMINICREHGVIVRVLTDFFGMSAPEKPAYELHAEAIASFCAVPNEGIAFSTKRLIDIAGASLLIILCGPLMFLVMLLIKADSDGPMIFSQDRVGLNKRIFRIYKFRSMVENAEQMQEELQSKNELQGPVFKIRHDPRITRIGRIIRKSSIDELPQLFNVLKGDMSLVGPRPMAVRDYSGFSEDWQRRRFSVRPGITCLWQVSGRNDITFDQWMRLDMEYIDQWSLWLDLKILARTIPAVLRGSGAA